MSRSLFSSNLRFGCPCKKRLLCYVPAAALRARLGSGLSPHHTWNLDLRLPAAALVATRANDELNQVPVTCHAELGDIRDTFDVVIAADVLYDRDNLPLLEELKRYAPTVIVADSRVKADKLQGYEVIHRESATTVPDLDESAEFNDVRVYRNL